MTNVASSIWCFLIIKKLIRSRKPREILMLFPLPIWISFLLLYRISKTVNYTFFCYPSSDFVPTVYKSVNYSFFSFFFFGAACKLKVAFGTQTWLNRTGRTRTGLDRTRGWHRTGQNKCKILEDNLIFYLYINIFLLFIILYFYFFLLES